MVYTYAESYASFAALRDESLQLTVRGAVVARIDTHLIDISRCDGCHLGHKVNVGYDSRLAAILAELKHNILKVFALLSALRRKTHDACTSCCDALHLCYARWGVGCGGVGH